MVTKVFPIKIYQIINDISIPIKGGSPEVTTHKKNDYLFVDSDGVWCRHRIENSNEIRYAKTSLSMKFLEINPHMFKKMEL